MPPLRPQPCSSAFRRLVETHYIPHPRHFSVLSRPPPNYPGHVPLTVVERAGLAVGSAIASMANHYRHDMVAALGEATAQPYFIHRLRAAMLASPTGRRILRDRPRLTSTTLDLPTLRSQPSSTLGHAYAAWLEAEGVSPDTRSSVRYIDDAECAYVMQRYRESHDFLHALTGLPIVAEGEIALKAFEAANLVLPMAALSLAAVARLRGEERQRFWDVYGPWAVRNGLSAEEVICVYWEEEMGTDVDVLRKRLGLEKPPDLREWRRKLKEEKKRAKSQGMSQSGAGVGFSKI